MKFVWLSLLSSALCLDVSAIGQVMVSRPVVIGAILGYLIGDIKSGIFIGAIIELVWIDVIPVGVSIPPDVTVSAVLAVCWYLAGINLIRVNLMGIEIDGLRMLLAIMLSIPAGMLFRRIDIIHRQFNVVLARLIDTKLDAGEENIVTKVSMLSVVLFFLKAFVFLYLFIPLGIHVMNSLCGLLSTGNAAREIRAAANFALMLAPAVGLGVIYGSFRKNYEKI